MKALVVGGGSIGRRHLENLKILGIRNLAVVETDIRRRRCLASELELLEFSALAEALDWSPDFVVLATPTYLHDEQALQVLRCGFHLFIEKPLCHTPEGLVKLLELSAAKQLVSMVACNLRFHPGPSKIRELLQQQRIGKLLFARIHAGSYLPDWRPSADYRQNYAAHEGTGGGCILDCIHEIDLARWYLGEVQEVFCAAAHISSLEITTEDFAVLVCAHENGARSEIHLDYVQRTYERGCQLVGEKGSIFWDFNVGQVRWYNAEAHDWTCFVQPEGWHGNQMYLDEMRHFLDCVSFHRESMLPITEAAAVMQIAFAAKKSSRQGRVVPVGTEVVA